MRNRPRKSLQIYEIARLITEDPDIQGDQERRPRRPKKKKRHKKDKLPNSLVGPDVAGGLTGRIVGELEKLGCSLDDYEIEWMGNGFKINIWNIECNSPEGQSEIRRRLKKDLPESGWDMSRYPSRYAYAAIADRIKKFAEQEFNVNINHAGFKDSDTIEVLVTPAREPLEPEEEMMPDDEMGLEPGLPPGDQGLEPGSDLEDVTLGLDDLEGIEGLGGEEGEEGALEEPEEDLF